MMMYPGTAWRESAVADPTLAVAHQPAFEKCEFSSWAFKETVLHATVTPTTSSSTTVFSQTVCWPLQRWGRCVCGGTALPSELVFLPCDSITFWTFWGIQIHDCSQKSKAFPARLPLCWPYLWPHQCQMLVPVFLYLCTQVKQWLLHTADICRHCSRSKYNKILSALLSTSACGAGCCVEHGTSSVDPIKPSLFC